MIITPKLTKDKLDTAISGISIVGWMYTKDPDTDFTRKRKLSLDTMIRLLLEFSGKSLQSELSACYSLPGKLPTKSAFVQQRQKILWEGCYALYRIFTDSLPYLKLFEGYRLLACDGSAVPLPRNEGKRPQSLPRSGKSWCPRLLHGIQPHPWNKRPFSSSFFLSVHSLKKSLIIFRFFLILCIIQRFVKTIIQSPVRLTS